MAVYFSSLLGMLLSIPCVCVCAQSCFPVREETRNHHDARTTVTRHLVGCGCPSLHKDNLDNVSSKLMVHVSLQECRGNIEKQKFVSDPVREGMPVSSHAFVDEILHALGDV
jgi:hypothetical protein